jgi:hypothetical protein
MADYIPKEEANKVLWLENFSTWVTANGATHGLSPAEIGDLGTTISVASTSVTNNTTAQAAARAATAAKNTALGGAVDMARDFAQRLQNDPNMTDEDRAAAGLTIRDETPTPGGGAPGVHEIPPPLLLLDFSVRQQVTVHWGTNPGNERDNHRPAGTIGCEVQAAQGGIPADPSAWTVLELDTESPMLHIVSDTVPTTYAYRARYVGKNLQLGPFGDPAVCTVSV